MRCQEILVKRLWVQVISPIVTFMDETNTNQIVDSGQRTIQTDDGDITLNISVRENGAYSFRIDGNGTSSCVDYISVDHQNIVEVSWNGKPYTYALLIEDAPLVLAEFIMTLSLGKTGNWIKKHNIMSEEDQAYHRSLGAWV